MLNSTIIDVAIGIVLAFLGVSLAASAITEAISSLFQLREKNLVAGVKALLNDKAFAGLALDLYNHALVNPLSSGAAKSMTELTHKPAYIDSKQFANAFYDVVSRSGASADPIANIADPQLKKAIETLWQTADKDVTKFKSVLANWFDGAMDRASGWYKRRTQWIAFLAALVVAGLLNINAIYEGSQIWSRPGLIAEISSKVPQNNDNGVELLKKLESAYLVGWVEGPMPHDTQSWFIAISSWLMVSAASLFGASFWFDILKRLVQVRGTGKVPPRSDEPPSTAPAS